MITKLNCITLYYKNLTFNNIKVPIGLNKNSMLDVFIVSKLTKVYTE